MSQTRITWSRPAVIGRRLSGVTVYRKNVSTMAFERTYRLTRIHVPQPNDSIGATRQYPMPIRRKRDRTDLICVRLGRRD